MAEAFLQLSPADKRDALLVAAQASGRPAHLLEKDVWVVWALATLFASTYRDHLVFKGGTSLSKAYHAIDRFSEDVDLTYDIRAIAPDLVGADGGALPAIRSQESRWTKLIHERLQRLVATEMHALLATALAADGLKARVAAENSNLTLSYDPIAEGTGYVSASVLLEFGARATGEPALTLPVTCDASPHLPSLMFPIASPRVMRVERTFWEKATAAHVYCRRGEFRGGARFARHWYDLAKLAETGHAQAALADRAIASAVATHKAAFFAERDSSGTLIDYQAAVTGGLQLVPKGEPLAALRDDYAAMIADGLIGANPMSFEAVMAICTDLEFKAGKASS